MIVATAVACLAINIYMESRGEPIIGQYGVALVTINRAKKSQDSICNTVFKPKQFSWTNSGVKRVKYAWKVATPKDDYAWEKAEKIAIHALAGNMPDFTKGADHYHATYVSPKWRYAMVPTKKIGNHIFYAAVSQS